MIDALHWLTSPVSSGRSSDQRSPMILGFNAPVAHEYLSVQLTKKPLTVLARAPRLRLQSARPSGRSGGPADCHPLPHSPLGTSDIG